MPKIYIPKIPLVLQNDKGEDYRVAEGEAVTLSDEQYAQLSEYVTVGEAADSATAAAIAEASADAPADTPPDTTAKTTAKRGQKAEA